MFISKPYVNYAISPKFFGVLDAKAIGLKNQYYIVRAAVEMGAVTPLDGIMRLLHSVGCLLAF